MRIDSQSSLEMMNWIPVAAFLLLYRLKYRRELGLLPALTEGASVFVFLYAIATSLLSLVDAYTHLLSSSLALLALLLPAGSEPDRRRSLRRSEAWTLAAVVLVLLPFLAQRSDFLALGADAGVYPNVAKNLVATGGTRFEPLVVSGLEPGWDAYPWLEADGLYRTEEGQLYYQFLPGWPAVLALGIHLFGPYDYTIIMPVLALLVAYWIFALLRQWLDGWRLLAGTCCLTLNPLFIYFSKYTTSELFLLLSTSFTLAAFVRSHRRRHVLSSIAVAAAAVTHISMFLYLPLLVVYAVWAARAGNRRSFRHVSALVLVFVAHLVAAYFFSPQYYRDTYSKFAAFTAELPFWAYPPFLAFLLIALLTLLYLSRGRLARFDLAWLAHLFPAWLVLLLIYSVFTGYQFGYTSTPVSLLTGDAYAIEGMDRALYIHRGLFSIVHLTIVNLALATGVVFLVAFALVVLGRRHRAIEDGVDLFLLCAVFFPFTFYALILPDFRFNYFQSRYFLPVVALCLIVLVLKRAAEWQPTLFWSLASLALVWNLFYSSFIARVPEYPGRKDLVQHLRQRVARDQPVLAVGGPWRVHALFANVVIYDLGSRYAYLGDRCDGGPRRLLRYIADREPARIFVISDSELSLPGAEVLREELVVANNRYEYWSNILYPYRYTAADEVYLLYELRRPTGLLDLGRALSADQIGLLSPCSYWSKPGDWSTGEFTLRLPRPIEDVTRITLETNGQLAERLRAHTGTPGEVILAIDGVDLRQVLSDVIVLDLPRSLQVSELEIRSSTFVPAELRINEDPRRLGLDLRRIVFE